VNESSSFPLHEDDVGGLVILAAFTQLNSLPVDVGTIR